jgi:hypothetical protein
MGSRVVKMFMSDTSFRAFPEKLPFNPRNPAAAKQHRAREG